MGYDSNEMIELEGIFLHETDGAILVDFDGDGDGEGNWFPKSLAEYEDEGYERGDPITVNIPLWLAEKEGLI